MSPVTPLTPPSTLLRLLGGMPVRLMVGDPRVKVTGLTYDSRRVQAGDCFVAVVGADADGHDYVDAALAAGAAALVVSRRPADVPASVPVAVVDDTRAALAQLATSWYRRPSRTVDVMGVTGTNGKTTVTYLLQALARAAGGEAAIIGTTGCRWRDRITPLPNTTPESLDLQRMLREVAEDGATHVALEVSSHGLLTHRLDGTIFATRTFTNLSREHLDFHGDMEAYYQAKRRLFVDLPGGPAAINADDAYGQRLLQEFRAAVSFSVRPETDAAVRPSGPVHLTPAGVEADFATPVGRVSVSSPLVGRPNLENLAAMLATGVALDLPASTLEAAAASDVRCPGRLERIPDPSGNRLLIVDYAHTPDALARVLGSVADLTPGDLIVVFGCGGERDAGKRPLMGEAAAAHAARVVLTDDNPRGEDPAAIRASALRGVPPADRDRVEEIGDRRQAIARAMAMAGPSDSVVIAGKGHEAWQEVAGERRPFDDAAVLAELLAEEA